jgi:hypothetical protein
MIKCGINASLFILFVVAFVVVSHSDKQKLCRSRLQWECDAFSENDDELARGKDFNTNLIFGKQNNRVACSAFQQCHMRVTFI